MAKTTNKIEHDLLINAISNNDYSIAKQLIENIDINTISTNGEFLALATRNGNSLIIRDLIKKGANVNLQDSNGNTPLNISIETGNIGIAKRFLLENQININAPDGHGDTPLDIAVQKGHSAIAKLLLEFKVNTQLWNDNGKTLLKLAMIVKSEELVKIAMTQGANINIKDEDGNTPLHLAILNGSNLTKVFLDNGADVNATNYNGKTPLHLAVEQKDSNLAVDLLKMHAAVNAKDFSGRTSLHLAIEQKDGNLVEDLLKKCADTSIKDDNGNTPLKLAFNLKNELVLQKIFAFSKVNPLPNITEEADIVYVIEQILKGKLKVKFKQDDYIVTSQDHGKEVNKYHPGNIETIEEESRTYIKDGKIYKHGVPLNADHALYVIGLDGTLYTAPESENMRHSYFLKGTSQESSYGIGKLVRAAGHISAIDGKITNIDNDSGHYFPNLHQLLLAAFDLMMYDVLSPKVDILSVQDKTHYGLEYMEAQFGCIGELLDNYVELI